MLAHRLAFLGAAAAAFLACAAPALAEEIVLVSGTRYDARDVEILDRDVRFSFALGGGSGTVTLPMERLASDNLVALLVARLDPKIGGSHLRIARVALDRGLLALAASRFRRAAEVDPALAPQCAVGLQAVKDAETAKILADAEQQVRLGRNDLAVDRAKLVLARATPGGDLAQRAGAIADLASRLSDRDRERAAKDAVAADEAQKAAVAAAFDAELGAADKAVKAALGQRAKVADPEVAMRDAVSALESAESLLKEGHRRLSIAREKALPARLAEVDGRDRDVVALLAANHLDLADLYRQQRRFDKARDLVRATLVLDPQNARAGQVTDRIEADLRVPPPAPYYPPDAFDAPLYVEDVGVPYVRRYAVPAPCPCPSRGFSFGRTSPRWSFFFRW